MAYCTVDDLALRLSKQNLIELTNDDPGSTEPNTDVIDLFIASSDSYIDGLLSGVYTTPFVPVPVLIKDISIVCTVYNLMLRRFASMDMPKGWADKYKDAMAMLNQIGDLLVSLDTNPGIQSPEGEMVSVPRKVSFDDDSNPMGMF